VARTGGLPIALMFSLPNGGAWIPDGMILFSMLDTFFPVFCVRRKPAMAYPAQSGTPLRTWYPRAVFFNGGSRLKISRIIGLIDFH